MKEISWINFVLGVWLIVAGFAFSSAVRPVMTEEIVLGIIIACLAFATAMRPVRGLSWLVAIAGLWTLIAPAVVPYAGLRMSRTNDMIVGIVVLVLGVINAVHRTPTATIQA